MGDLFQPNSNMEWDDKSHFFLQEICHVPLLHFVVQHRSFSSVMFFFGGGCFEIYNRKNQKGSSYEMLWLMQYRKMNEYMLTIFFLVFLLAFRSLALQPCTKTFDPFRGPWFWILVRLKLWSFPHFIQKLKVDKGTPIDLKGLPLTFTFHRYSVGGARWMWSSWTASC